MTYSVLRHRWFIMAIIFLARTTMAMQFQSIAPVAPLVVADLGITYAQLGLLIGLYLLPGTVLALPGGLLGQRFGNRRVALSGLALMVIGGFVVASSHSLWPVRAGRLLSGAGGVLLNLILAKMTAEWFAGKEISTAMSIMLISWPFGIGLGATVFGAVGATSSWRLVQHLAAALAAGAFVLVAILGRDAPGVGATGSSLRFLPSFSAGLGPDPDRRCGLDAIQRELHCGGGLRAGTPPSAWRHTRTRRISCEPRHLDQHDRGAGGRRRG